MYCCNNCGREYKILSYYKRHQATCDIIKKTGKELQNEEEVLADTPDIRKLYDIILEMNMQIKTLQKKVKQLENNNHAKQKKINVMDWLRSLNPPRYNWDEWCTQVEFTNTHLSLVFQNSIIAGMFKSIKDCFETGDATNLPLQAFIQKPGVLFLYYKDGWQEVTYKEIESLVCMLHKKCMSQFMIWQKEAERDMTSTEFTCCFTENIHKINSKTTVQISKSIFQKLYEEYKINIKSVVKIDVE